MAQQNLVSFFLIAAILLGCQAHASDLCDKAEYVELCKSVVKGATDPKAAIKTSIEFLLSETRRLKASSEKLKSSQFIDVCTDNYDSAIDDLNNSLQNLRSNDIASLQITLSGSLSFYETCNDALAEGGKGVVQVASRLVKQDHKLQHIAANALHFASLLK
ncbi:uncharacterized protein LOC111477633 [Cucurbita maxima]|uniref:Uncharacterized protein LOC111477633 n=1 Tax=Cucurbita maxima TaxID=3661 RepID=A0A6J1ILU1_CUCMA|nr:uncharacterized protein LOC111477633 [Cucurbita maxima]